MNLAKSTWILAALTARMLAGVAEEHMIIPPGSYLLQTFGMVGVAAGQSMRVNVLNAGVLTPTAQPFACAAQVFFLNDQGVVIKRAAVNASPGRSQSIDIHRDVDIAAGQNRVEVRAVVTSVSFLVSTSGQPSHLAFCQIVPTLEVFDDETGRTTVLLRRPTNFIALPGIVGGGIPFN
jgi:hypothetical protein